MQSGANSQVFPIHMYYIKQRKKLQNEQIINIKTYV